MESCHSAATAGTSPEARDAEQAALIGSLGYAYFAALGFTNELRKATIEVIYDPHGMTDIDWGYHLRVGDVP